MADTNAAAFLERHGMYPFTAPGMPPPGPNFLRQARALGDGSVYEKKTSKGKVQIRMEIGRKLLRMYKQALRTPGFSLEVETRAQVYKPAVFVPGHIWGQHMNVWRQSQVDPRVEPLAVDGPHPADVMVIGKMPWKDETAEGRNLIGLSGELLLKLLRQLHFTGISRWYVTNLVKFMPPDESGTLKVSWINDCLPLLHQELRLVRPKFILCLGADASKALLGKKHGVGFMEGRVLPFRFPVSLEVTENIEHHHCQIMTVLHPTQATRDEAMTRVLERGLARFHYLQKGADFSKEDDIDHRLISTLDEAEAWAFEADAELKANRENVVAWDAEWHGQHPINKGAYLRTVQASWAHKKAVVFNLRDDKGKTIFRDADDKPAIKRLYRLLKQFMRRRRAVGHFFVSDLEWLVHDGLDLRPEFAVPLFDSADGTPAWQRCQRGEGGADTGAMVHAAEETAVLGLESLAMRYTTAPRYDIPLAEWKTQYCKAKGIKKEALEGYGPCPDDILLGRRIGNTNQLEASYSAYDADVTRRIFFELRQYLDRDYKGQCCWEPFWETMIIQPVLLEMKQNGVCVDRKKINELTASFMSARADAEDKIVTAANWPGLNIRSVQHVREYLFGEALNGKVSKAKDGAIVRLRPEKAVSLHLQPLLDTGKPAKRWIDIVAQGREREHSPSTNKSVLAILAQDNPQAATEVNNLRDYRFLDQVLKSVLRPPKAEVLKGGLVLVEDENGQLVYEKGLAAAIDVDGRVRTSLIPTAETGRWKSARPNLQNISKQRDGDYLRLLGPERYKETLRSMLVAAPGKVLIEFDYKGAELFVSAILAGDNAMIDHMSRNRLREDHPDYYDIHSSIAVLAFRLDCPPTKKGLKEIKKAHLRTIAKTVIFGMMYGRQAKAIALACKEQGVDVSVEEAQRVIDTVFEMYPRLQPFFAECCLRATNEGWLSSCFGRLRRFPPTTDDKLAGEFERQAMNFPIQSAVASALDRGLAMLRWGLQQRGLQNEVKILLAIHDAALLETSPAYVDELCDPEHGLIRWAMCDRVPLWPTRLDGTPTGKGPYYLSTDIGVYERWSVDLTVADAQRLGLPERYGVPA